MKVDDEARPSTQLHRWNQRKTPPNLQMKIERKYSKIMKNKNNPYNLEMRFMHKDKLY
jgi:hypothetical protein